MVVKLVVSLYCRMDADKLYNLLRNDILTGFKRKWESWMENRYNNGYWLGWLNRISIRTPVFRTPCNFQVFRYFTPVPASRSSVNIWLTISLVQHSWFISLCSCKKCIAEKQPWINDKHLSGPGTLRTLKLSQVIELGINLPYFLLLVFGYDES